MEKTEAMATITRATGQTSLPRSGETADSPSFWYAAYTFAHHEKKAATMILSRGIESLLPLYHTVRRWSDGRVELKTHIAESLNCPTSIRLMRAEIFE